MKRCILAIVGLAVALPAVSEAQQAAQQPQTVAAFVRARYNTRKGDVVRSAEKMPEEFYNLRPGQQEEVRTFGQHTAHIANFNYLWCSQAKGEKNPSAGINLEKTLHTKAEFVKALKDSYAYCDTAYDALTDANGNEVMTFTPEGSTVQRQLRRMALLVLNQGHNEETYGSMATTMRIKNLVPGSSEPRPAQAPAPPR